MSSRRSSVPFSSAAETDANEICFASSYTSSKTHGKSAQKSTTVARNKHAGDVGVGQIKGFSATFFRATLRRLSVKGTNGQNEKHNQIAKNG
jgi:hypothetical protein